MISGLQKRVKKGPKGPKTVQKGKFHALIDTQLTPRVQKGVKKAFWDLQKGGHFLTKKEVAKRGKYFRSVSPVSSRGFQFRRSFATLVIATLSSFQGRNRRVLFGVGNSVFGFRNKHIRKEGKWPLFPDRNIDDSFCLVIPKYTWKLRGSRKVQFRNCEKLRNVFGNIGCYILSLAGVIYVFVFDRICQKRPFRTLWIINTCYYS